MTEASPSPKVPLEGLSRRLPIFSSKKSTFSRKILSANAFPVPRPSKSSYSSSIGRSLGNLCSCPHVLIADDDSFQEFYYTTLFSKSIDFDALTIEKRNFRVKVVKSGEELLEEYNEMRSCCNCHNLSMVITDYDMGHDKKTGVATALELRNLGYRGPLMLRTSETRQYLIEHHANFEEMIERKTIDYYIEKNAHMKMKQVFEKVLGITYSKSLSPSLSKDSL